MLAVLVAVYAEEQDMETAEGRKRVVVLRQPIVYYPGKLILAILPSFTVNLKLTCFKMNVFAVHHGYGHSYGHDNYGHHGYGYNNHHGKIILY